MNHMSETNIKNEIPAEFWDRMKRVLEEDFDAFYNSYDADNVRALRLNPLKSNDMVMAEVTSEYCTEPVPWCKDGFYYDSERRPGKDALHEAGAYYIQEPSAMAVGTLLDAKPGERVLDMCAAPGGKTTHIAGQMCGEGLLVSSEIDSVRAKILSRNVERLGIKNCIVTNNAPDELAEVFPGFFDRILVDSPCSGEGMFKKEEAAVSNWSVDNVKMCAERSKGIVDAAVKMLSEGGVLVYSTCTFAPEEDEYIIKYILDKYPFMRMYPSDDPVFATLLSHNICEEETFCGDNPGIYRIWPHIHKGEGHFIARLVRDSGRSAVLGSNGDPACIDTCVDGSKMEAIRSLGPTEEYRGKAKKREKKSGYSTGVTKEQMKVFLSFLEQEPYIDPNRFPVQRLRMSRDTLWLIPESCPALADLRVIRQGLELGTFKKDRFEPAHAYAMALTGKELENSFETEDPEIFLSGNTYQCGEGLKGWIPVTYKDLPLGWGKAGGGVIKNHYPKGLRR